MNVVVNVEAQGRTGTKFQQKHELMYGLRITKRAIDNKKNVCFV